jgi:hypothetical protein
MSGQHQRLHRPDLPDRETGAGMGEGMVAGIDWASEVHAVCVMDGHGRC